MMMMRWMLGAATVIVILIALSWNRTSTREHVLANGPGPEDADAPEEFTATASGLQYRVLRKGAGDQPQLKDKVTVNYTGWLDNGKQFDSSYDSAPVTFPLKGVVRGWAEGLQLVREGGMIELEIPSDLGYGAKGVGATIPPNATLHFIVELIEVLPESEPIEPGPQDPDAPEEFTTTDSGLSYRILRNSDGTTPHSEDQVTVHYRGWLDDGTVFDSSYDRGEPVSFPLNRVIAGWSEGLMYVGEGGMVELEIPGSLAYGADGAPGIPSNATLHFLVELLEVQ